ncbi:NUDIX hydrolase [Paenibacillus prosopidis]|uniref:8-oxo-dGTP diphosphatase n=1 Tax=Paenibacillus prosopidis TaxID=630520 RepID=A0A368W8D8_9BACL|nr:8-oxo-dGTP diphosphatase [Paenibacillus prosopidis]RCW50377.1 8-oxo-dGTP diphosphatase [Paenibacillus prosopidis]
MLKYNICFIKRGQEILLLNREYPSWMGCWNGIGGKLELHETPRESMIREIEEETNIRDYVLHFKGIVTWTSDGSNFGGMYAYVAEVSESFEYQTPIKTVEGILDWKKIDWIMHSQNVGVASNLPETLDLMLNDSHSYDHHCVYLKGKLQEHIPTLIHPHMETDEWLREQYFQKYLLKQGFTR